MVAAVAKWRTRPGIRRTQLTDTLSVDVEAWTSVRAQDAGGEGGVDRVEFAVVQNGGSPTTTTVYAPALRYPNYSDQDSPLPGVTSGMAPIWAYGITLECAALAAGTIEVTAVVYSTAGTATALPGSVVLYNDSDGVDRRPSTKQIFVSPTGNDSNPGTEAQPMLSLMRAVAACRANTGGSTAADADCGGAEVVMMPGAHLWAGGHNGVTAWHTSGSHWLTVTFQAGATIARTLDGGGGTLYPESYLTATGYVSGNNTCRLRFVGGEWIGQGGVVFASSGVTAHVWIDGGTFRSAHWSESNRWSVRFHEDYTNLLIGFDGPGIAAGRRYGSCVTRRGATFGMVGFTDMHDFLVTDFLGVAMQSTGDEPGNSWCNGLIEHQRYAYGAVAGYVDLVPGANVTISVPVAGTMRITATADQTTDWGALLSELVGTTYWGVETGGATSSGNNAACSLVTAVGGTALRPWVELANPSAVAEVGGSSFRMRTARASTGDLFTTVIHPDVHQWDSDRTETMHSGIAVRDVPSAQGWFSGGHNLTRCVMVNCTDGGAPIVNNFTDSSFTDCLFFHCSFSGPWDWTGSPETFTGTEIVDCVVSGSNFPGASAALVSHCHFTSGSTYGTSPSSGVWFAGATAADPWAMTPALGNLNTASATIDRPAAWRFTSATSDSRGAWRNVAEHDWSAGAAVQGDADLPACVWVPLAGAGTVAIVAAADLPTLVWVPLQITSTTTAPEVMPDPVMPAIPWLPDRRQRFGPRDPMPVTDREMPRRDRRPAWLRPW